MDKNKLLLRAKRVTLYTSKFIFKEQHVLPIHRNSFTWEVGGRSGAGGSEEWPYGSELRIKPNSSQTNKASKMIFYHIIRYILKMVYVCFDKFSAHRLAVAAILFFEKTQKNTEITFYTFLWVFWAILNAPRNGITDQVELLLDQ